MFLKYCLLFLLFFFRVNANNLMETFNKSVISANRNTGSFTINDKYIFKYSFPQGIRKGISLMRIEILDTNEERNNSIILSAQYNKSGFDKVKDAKVKKNEKNKLYFIPFSFVSLGKYEVVFNFAEENGEIFYSKNITFNVKF